MRVPSSLAVVFLAGSAFADGKAFDEDSVLSDFGQCVLFQRAAQAMPNSTEVSIEGPEAYCRSIPRLVKPPYQLNAWDKASLRYLQEFGRRGHRDYGDLPLSEACGKAEGEAEAFFDPLGAPERCAQSRDFLRASGKQQAALRSWCEGLNQELTLLFRYVLSCERGLLPGVTEIAFLKAEHEKLMDRILTQIPVENPDPAAMEALVKSPEGQDAACVQPLWNSVVTRKIQHSILSRPLFPLLLAVDDCAEGKMSEKDKRTLGVYFPKTAAGR